MPTCRYTLALEASVLALEDIKINTLIYGLLGFPVQGSNNLITKLESKREINSIIEVKGAPHLLIGPISRVNHDCDPNAKFMLQPKIRGKAPRIGMTATRHISKGEEITVLYSTHYFGKDSEDCLCLSCEVVGRNGWSSKAAGTPFISEQVRGRMTRQTAKRRKVEMLKQATYSYRALSSGLGKRQSRDYFNLILESDVNSCSVCGLRVAYSYVGYACNSCYLRRAPRTSKRRQQKQSCARDHTEVYEGPKRMTDSAESPTQISHNTRREGARGQRGDYGNSPKRSGRTYESSGTDLTPAASRLQRSRQRDTV